MSSRKIETVNQRPLKIAKCTIEDTFASLDENGTFETSGPEAEEFMDFLANVRVYFEKKQRKAMIKAKIDELNASIESKLAELKAEYEKIN